MNPVQKNIIEVEHLYKSFGENHVLRDFSLTIGRGENLAILGKSGSGKSVLIKCIVRLITADRGSITVMGKGVGALDRDELDRLRRDVGFLFQSNALYDSMTVRENLTFPLRHHWNKKEIEESGETAVMEALEDVGLTHTLKMMPAELSGGMKKRIALARTLILKPAIILYDEPTTGLDPITAREISRLITTVQRKYGTTSIIISHDMNCINLTSDRVVILIDGRCYANDTYENLKRSKDANINEFFD